VTVEWKEFGVKLTMKADIGVSGKDINMDIMPEVSNLDFGNAIVVNGMRLPAFRTRRVRSSLNIQDHQTLVIGGLYQSEQSLVQSKLPLLGDLPVLGYFFKRSGKQKQESELVVFVTPEIVTEASSAARTGEELKRVGEKP
jgi:pilus assembly protein CpaC